MSRALVDDALTAAKFLDDTVMRDGFADHLQDTFIGVSSYERYGQQSTHQASEHAEGKTLE